MQNYYNELQLTSYYTTDSGEKAKILAHRLTSNDNIIVLYQNINKSRDGYQYYIQYIVISQGDIKRNNPIPFTNKKAAITNFKDRLGLSRECDNLYRQKDKDNELPF